MTGLNNDLETERSIPEILAHKRDGKELNPQDIRKFITDLVDGRVADSQLGAWLMAVYLMGLTERETSELTRSMVSSGETLAWPDHWNKKLIVDKHSTGGVGDKVSLPLAPALAACGVKVPMISGRGLDLTGGTLDKMESIPGFRVNLDKTEMVRALEDIGFCIVGQTEKLCPADRLMYKTRDVTGTVACQGLIVASIVGKKVAEGLSSLVIDVKWGSGTFMKTQAEAKRLAEFMRRTAGSLGLHTTGVISHMCSPLGRAVGNSLEVLESVECLRGGGPADLRELVCVEGGLLLHSVGLAPTRFAGERMICSVLDNGDALEKFRAMLVFQGVSESAAAAVCSGLPDLQRGVLPAATSILPLLTPEEGVVTGIDAGRVGRVALALGAGRTFPGEKLDLSVGVMVLVTVGERVVEGQVWAELHHNKQIPHRVIQMAREAVCIEEKETTTIPRVSQIME